jgi:hypothetical protein
VGPPLDYVRFTHYARGDKDGLGLGEPIIV